MSKDKKVTSSNSKKVEFGSSAHLRTSSTTRNGLPIPSLTLSSADSQRVTVSSSGGITPVSGKPSVDKISYEGSADISFEGSQNLKLSRDERSARLRGASSARIVDVNQARASLAKQNSSESSDDFSVEANGGSVFSTSDINKNMKTVLTGIINDLANFAYDKKGKLNKNINTDSLIKKYKEIYKQQKSNVNFVYPESLPKDLVEKISETVNSLFSKQVVQFLSSTNPEKFTKSQYQAEISGILFGSEKYSEAVASDVAKLINGNTVLNNLDMAFQAYVLWGYSSKDSQLDWIINNQSNKNTNPNGHSNNRITELAKTIKNNFGNELGLFLKDKFPFALCGNIDEIKSWLKPEEWKEVTNRIKNGEQPFDKSNQTHKDFVEKLYKRHFGNEKYYKSVLNSKFYNILQGQFAENQLNTNTVSNKLRPLTEDERKVAINKVGQIARESKTYFMSVVGVSRVRELGYIATTVAKVGDLKDAEDLIKQKNKVVARGTLLDSSDDTSSNSLPKISSSNVTNQAVSASPVKDGVTRVPSTPIKATPTKASSIGWNTSVRKDRSPDNVLRAEFTNNALSKALSRRLFEGVSYENADMSDVRSYYKERISGINSDSKKAVVKPRTLDLTDVVNLQAVEVNPVKVMAVEVDLPKEEKKAENGKQHKHSHRHHKQHDGEKHHHKHHHGHKHRHKENHVDGGFVAKLLDISIEGESSKAIGTNLVVTGEPVLVKGAVREDRALDRTFSGRSHWAEIKAKTGIGSGIGK